MELKEFVENAITQIAEGVHGAIKSSSGKGYMVNPSFKNPGTTYTIHFDLCVESGKEGEADIKVLSGIFSERSVNRITFDVNMTFPSSDVVSVPNRIAPSRIETVQTEPARNNHIP